jgi:hypothetical protein
MTTLQLARLFGSLKNFGERRLIAAVLLDVAEAFHTVRVEGLLYKLTILHFPSYLVKTISSYLHCRTFQTSFKSATIIRHNMQAGVAKCGLVSPCAVQSACKRHSHALSPRRVSAVHGRHGPRSPSLLVGNLKPSQEKEALATIIAFFGQPLQWIESCSRIVLFGLHVNTRSGQYVRTVFPIYKQLIHPMTDYALPIWRSAACSHVHRLQVL